MCDRFWILLQASVAMEESFSLLATLRFDPFLETLSWNNDPDGLPSPYLLLSYQFHRLATCSLALQWPSKQDLTFTKLKSACDTIVRNVNGAGPNNPLRVGFISPVVRALSPTAPIDTSCIVTRQSHCIRLTYPVFEIRPHFAVILRSRFKHPSSV